VDRYLAAHMAHQVGNHFDARVSGVTRFGLFVTLDSNGASGIVPLGSLPDDRWTEDGAGRSLVGQRTGMRFTLGQVVEARLAAADARTGSLVFHLPGGAAPAAPSRGASGRGGGGGRSASGRGGSRRRS
jgi:ribonuclease R